MAELPRPIGIGCLPRSRSARRHPRGFGCVTHDNRHSRPKPAAMPPPGERLSQRERRGPDSWRPPNARTGDHRARTRRRARRQVTLDAGRRVRARGDSSRSRRKARCALDEAGDRHRLVEGAARGRSRSTQGNLGAAEDESRPQAHASIGAAVACGAQGAEARGAPIRIASRAVAAGEVGCTAALERAAIRGGAQGGTHQGTAKEISGRAEGRTYTCATSPLELAIVSLQPQVERS